ncbi:MAG: amino acid permease [Ardenticatenaceae bacterium]
MLDRGSNEDLVRYENMPRGYLERRQLHKGVSWRWLPSWLLVWGLGVGASIWAHFSIFGSAVPSGEMAVALALMTVVYGCFVFTMAELSAAWPHTGGFYAFARIAFGPLGGFVCGVGLSVAYLLMSALMAVGISGYLSTLLPGMPSILWLLLLYVIFLVINIRSTRWALTVGLMLTLLALLLLCLLMVEGLPPVGSWLVRVDFAQLGSLSGWRGVFAALPFAVWSYLGLEQMPLLAEESEEAAKNAPKALKAGLGTVVLLSLLSVLLRITADEGLFFDTESAYPLALIGLIGWLATFQAMMVAYARILFALSRAGYLPHWLSLTSGYQTPNRALIMGSLVSLIGAFVIEWGGGFSFSGAEVLNQPLLGAVLASTMLSYALVMASYIKLKRQHPYLPRPYTSPLGQFGAVGGLIGAMMILLAGFYNDAYRPSMVGMAFFLFCSLFYFLFVSSQRLVAQAPEEQLALRGDPLMIRRLIVRRVMLLLALVGGISGLMRLIVVTLGSPCPPECGGVSLIRENFSGADLSQANLVFANLLQADLSEANLRGADLSGAHLSEATLANTDLSDAKLIGADLSDADLGGAIVSSADMSGAKLNESQLTHVDLTKAILKGVALQQAELLGADMSGLNLAGVECTGAQMKEANLAGANLAGSTLSGADLSGANLTGADLAGAWLNKSNLTGTNLSGADLSGASLIGANLTSAQLDGVQLVGANLIGATMARTNLRGANLKLVRWKKSHLVEQDLSLDSTLANLNELELKELLKDAQISAIQFDNQTIWPNNHFYGISNNPSRPPNIGRSNE